MKRWRKIYHVKPSQKKAAVAVLISDKLCPAISWKAVLIQPGSQLEEKCLRKVRMFMYVDCFLCLLLSPMRDESRQELGLKAE